MPTMLTRFKGVTTLSVAVLITASSVQGETTAPWGIVGQMLISETSQKNGPAETTSDTAKPGSDPTLSEKLDASDGVIKPPKNIDPEMTQQPPNIGATMPVIPPSAVRPDTAPNPVEPKTKQSGHGRSDL